MVKRLVVLAACLALQACAVVSSEKPLFSAQDSKGAPAMRTGVWAMPQKDCPDFDPKAATDKWPECANLIIVTETTVGGDQHEKDGTIKSVELAYVLAGGEPRVMQLTAPADKKPDDPNFFYLGVQPLKTDKQGRIIEGRLWLALCAEPPAAKDMFKKTKKAKPLPGLKMDKDNESCLAEAQQPVRDAVKATEQWLKKAEIEDAIITARWVRDGGR